MFDTECLQSKLALSDEASAQDFANTKGKLKLGLFSYPVLQAADILLYKYELIIRIMLGCLCL